jgi:hypothetical protein
MSEGAGAPIDAEIDLGELLAKGDVDVLALKKAGDPFFHNFMPTEILLNAAGQMSWYETVVFSTLAHPNRYVSHTLEVGMYHRVKIAKIRKSGTSSTDIVLAGVCQ